MKLVLVLFTVFVGVYVSKSMLPNIPGDNSHYVEGVSRYIWMTDDQGEPRLVDLHEPADESVLLGRNGANNRYYFYSRQNPTSPREIVNNNANSISAAGYSANRPLMVLSHGWVGNLNSPMYPRIISNLLEVQDCNVIVIDWGGTAGLNYASAVAGVPSVGQFLGNFLTWLVSTSGTNWNNVHLVGFSLGAHVVGNAGRTTGNRPIRVTGLDPAGPLWQTNSIKLRDTDGQYVECIHTDSFLQGIGIPLGNADFYPNGGDRVEAGNQPGCSDSDCNHHRAVEFFASSVRYNQLVGRQCTNVAQAGANACTGTAYNMGNNILTKRGSGIYGLRTGSAWPY